NSTMSSFGQTKSKDRSFFKQISSLFLGLLIGAHPYGSQSQNGHLETIPVTQAVESQQFAIFTVASRVPTAIRITTPILAGSKKLRKDLFFTNEIDKL